MDSWIWISHSYSLTWYDYGSIITQCPFVDYVWCQLTKNEQLLDVILCIFGPYVYWYQTKNTYMANIDMHPICYESFIFI